MAGQGRGRHTQGGAHKGTFRIFAVDGAPNQQNASCSFPPIFPRRTQEVMASVHTSMGGQDLKPFCELRQKLATCKLCRQQNSRSKKLTKKARQQAAGFEDGTSSSPRMTIRQSYHPEKPQCRLPGACICDSWLHDSSSDRNEKHRVSNFRPPRSVMGNYL